jgi:hypothetical protein
MSEHDFEPIRGLPGDLPEGETILWQGAPDWKVLAQEAFHIRAVAAYFAAMLVWRTAGALSGGESVPNAIMNALQATPFALAGLGILAFLAWLNSRTTVYTITNRRVVLRFGAALTKAINLPFTVLDGASLKALPQDAGDLALTLKAPNKIAFLQLWPHARPWRLQAPEPTLRAIPQAHSVAEILAGAMQRQMATAPVRSVAQVRGAPALASQNLTPQTLAPLSGVGAHAA